MLKTIHIHTDLKFISSTTKFEGKHFENHIVIIGNPDDYNGPNKKNALFFTHTLKSVHNIIELCSGADLVVLYDLDFIKCKIALGLPTKTIIAWRFFGYELYREELKFYTSALTQKTLLLSKTQQIKKFQNRVFDSIKTHWEWGLFSKFDFEEVLNRISIFLCFSQKEYDHLLTRWPNLPIFVRLPIKPSPGIVSDFFQKEKYIIVGNNRSFFNNHLDVIEIIDAQEKQNQYQFVLLFNYGNESNYSYKVRDAVRGKEHFKVIDNFMPLDKLNELYRKTSAAVFNGYRQMALGNIFLSVQNGVKIYLNKKNHVMQYLISEGFIIYSIDELGQDLENGNISLSVDEAKHNAEQYLKMWRSYTFDDFQKALYSLIKENISGKLGIVT